MSFQDYFGAIGYITLSELLYALAFLEWLIIVTAMLNAIVYVVYLVILMARGEMVNAPDRFSGVSWFKSRRASRVQRRDP